MSDPLYISSPRDRCRACGGTRRARRTCDACHGVGYAEATLRGHWANTAAFLVCGGPSLRTLPLDSLRDRGVLALGVNNAAAFAPCSAAVFSDPQWKFSHALFLDGKMLTFAPTPKLSRRVRIKCDDGRFRFIDRRLADCPSVYGVSRSGRFDAQTFLSTWFAHWGHGGKGDKTRPFTRLATMLIGLRLLHYLGCPRVYLLGVDFWQDSKAEAYAWGAGSGGNGCWPKIDAMLGELRAVFDAADFAVRNCNPASRCETFEHVPFEAALADCRGLVPSGPLDLADWYSHRRMAADREALPAIEDPAAWGGRTR